LEHDNAFLPRIERCADFVVRALTPVERNNPYRQRGAWLYIRNCARAALFTIEQCA